MAGAVAGSRLLTPAESGGRKAGSVDLEIGQRIRRLRNAKHLSQEDLEARIGISCQQLQKYESGANRISASRLVQLADALTVEISLFLRDGAVNDGGSNPGLISDGAAASTPSGGEIMSLLTAFCAVSNPASRAKIVDMAAFLVALEQGEPRR